MRTAALLAALLAPVPTPCRARVISGKASSTHGFSFLGSFTFDNDAPETEGPVAQTPCGGKQRTVVPTPGQTQVTITLSGTYRLFSSATKLQVYLYDDEADSWPAVWVDHAPTPARDLAACHARAAIWHPPGKPPSAQLQPGETRAGHLPCDGVINVTALPFTFTRTIFQRARPRTWFVALGQPDCHEFSEISYDVHFQNSGGTWKNQFGVNEQGLNWLYGVFFIAYLGLIWLQFYSRSIYRHEHHLPKLLSIVLVAEGVSAFLFALHYLTYTFDGAGLPLIKFFGENFQALSKLVMVLLLVLIAQGWTIVRAEIQDRQLIVGMMGALLFGTFFILLWGEYPATSQQEEDDGFLSWLGRDAASTKYIYEEKPGKLLLFLDFAIGGTFAATIFRTIYSCDAVRQLHQRDFMIRIGVVYGFYLLVVPLFIQIFQHVLDPWAEEKWVRTLVMLTSFSANAAMLWLIWPTRQENHFLQAGNFKKVAANAEIHRAGLSDSLLAGRLVGPDTARAIHGGF